MKKSKQCPKCNGLKIGYVERLPDGDGDGLEENVNADEPKNYPRRVLLME